MSAVWMNKLEIPPVKRLMTPFPFSLQAADSLAIAREMMASHGIHHLPVKHKGELVGVVSERDLRGVSDDDSIAVSLVMSSPPFVVDLNQPIDQVLLEMARRNVGCALVSRGDQLAGILTTTDACREFARLVRHRAGKSDEGGVA